MAVPVFFVAGVAEQFDFLCCVDMLGSTHPGRWVVVVGQPKEVTLGMAVFAQAPCPFPYRLPDCLGYLHVSP